MDDLIELVVDVGIDVVEGVLKHHGKKVEKNRLQKTEAKLKDPWDQKAPKPHCED